MKEIKQRMTQQIETALMKLNHVPYIVSKGTKMAVWSDIREVLFLRCVHPRCTVILSALKSHLDYPASEKSMHPCSPSEQILFMKEFKALSTGTLLVDLEALGNRFDLMALYDMIKIKHDLSENEIIQSCRNMSLTKKHETYFQKCVENPLANLTKRIFLPSIQRRKSNVEHCQEQVNYKNVMLNPFPNDKIVYQSKLKAFADSQINVTQKLRRVENMWEKEKIPVISVCQRPFSHNVFKSHFSQGH